MGNISSPGEKGVNWENRIIKKTIRITNQKHKSQHYYIKESFYTEKFTYQIENAKNQLPQKTKEIHMMSLYGI